MFVRLAVALFCVAAPLGCAVADSPTAAPDDLIAARCQSKCLRDFELRVKNQTDLRRQLRHEILSLCRDDRNCSACLIPCTETLEAEANCASTLCRLPTIPTAEFLPACEDSCTFRDRISRKKPGQCAAAPVDLVAVECSATCNRDSDCKEAEKCCTRGCSRSCAAPAFAVDDTKLLPIPDGITVQERKRKRSAVVRWVMKKLTPAHMATNANVYVVQWRWGIQKDPDQMTSWQTIVIKNKMYAILKHVLAPGRWYVFRVAAVNWHGAAGFSRSSAPFKLSKQPRAPVAPANLSVAERTFEADSSKWRISMQWSPPASELPIRDYVLSYWKSTLDGVELYERNEDPQGVAKAALVQRRAEDDEEEVEEEDEADVDLANRDPNNGSAGRKSTVLPSYSTRAELNELLDADSVYVVELYANVDSSDGELRGESAIHVLRTAAAQSDSPTDTKSPISSRNYYDPVGQGAASVDSSREEEPKIGQPSEMIAASAQPANTDEPNESTLFRAELQPPYLMNGNVRSTLSWLDHHKCSSERRDFEVRLQSVRCARVQSTEQLLGQCVAQLEALYFSCDYVVEVRDAEDRELITRMAFSTPPCSRTPTTEKVDCRLFDERPTVRCLPAASGTHSAVECEWKGVEDERATVGFRAVLTSTKAAPNVTIVGAGVRELRYDQLTDGTDYRLTVQAVTTTGLGREVETEFRTGAAGGLLHELGHDRELGMRLEATLSSSTRPKLLFPLIFVAVWRIFCRIFV